MTIIQENCGVFILWIEVEGLPFAADPMHLGNLTGGTESDTSHPNGLRPGCVWWSTSDPGSPPPRGHRRPRLGPPSLRVWEAAEWSLRALGDEASVGSSRCPPGWPACLDLDSKTSSGTNLYAAMMDGWHARIQGGARTSPGRRGCFLLPTCIRSDGGAVRGLHTWLSDTWRSGAHPTYRSRRHGHGLSSSLQSLSIWNHIEPAP